MPIPQATTAIGIDLGITRFATLSDGTYYAPLNRFKRFKRFEAALRKAQQALSRKNKFSHNWRKAKARIQRLHVRISNARRDYLHKISTTISQNHAMVCIEDLKVISMSKSAAGTTDAPGKNVNTKRGLNKAILDQGWFAFRRQLDYKLAWLVTVPPHYTSQTCPECLALVQSVVTEEQLEQAVNVIFLYLKTIKSWTVGLASSYGGRCQLLCARIITIWRIQPSLSCRSG